METVAHDARFDGNCNNTVAANQDYDMTRQLNDGIRMLQVQAHNGSDGQIHLCHTSCVSFPLHLRLRLPHAALLGAEERAKRATRHLRPGKVVTSTR